MLSAFTALGLFTTAGLMHRMNVLGSHFLDGGLNFPFRKSIAHTDVHETLPSRI